MSARLAVTEADLSRADRVLEAVAAKDRKTLAALLAEVRQEALSCAMVRAEREFEIRLRKQPGLPFDEAATQRQSEEQRETKG